jgi:hypothetical protein
VYKIKLAIETWRIKVAQRIILVVVLGCNSFGSLLVRYNAPIFIIGSPNAAHIPAINKSVIGFGSKK